MSGSGGDMLAASRRDPNFRGIDTDALGQLVKQVTDGTNAIRSWLGAHQPPPGVSSAGYTAAADVGRWVDNQIGMLTRRRNFALSHPDQSSGVPTPTPPKLGGKGGQGSPGSGPVVPRPSKKPRRLVPSGAGPHLGHYPTTGAATKAATADLHAIEKAERDHTAVPAAVWARLRRDAKDPDYARALVEGLGANGVAGLISAAHGNHTELHEISQLLGTASHHMTMTKTWLTALVTRSEQLHDRQTAVTVLLGAPWSANARAALDKVLATGHLTPVGATRNTHIVPPPHFPMPKHHPVTIGSHPEPED